MSTVKRECHVCGSEFQKSALATHQQRCIQQVLKKIKSGSSRVPIIENQPSKDSFDAMFEAARNLKLVAPAAGPASSSSSKKSAKETTQQQPIQHQQEFTEVEENLVRYPCEICNRKFGDTERLEKHMNACAKAKKQRKIFDASQARVKGTELEQYAKLSKYTAKKEVVPVKKSNWRQKHENFLKIVRAAKNPGSLANERVIDTSDYVACAHCNRQFHQDVAARHIPICKEIQVKKSLRGSPTKSPEKDTTYKKRMTYRPPPPKTKTSPLKK